jgi:hypothetical protein
MAGARVRDHQEHDQDTDSYIVGRNTIFKVYEGTQCVAVTTKLMPSRFGEGQTQRHLYAERVAVAHAIRTYERRFGLVDWTRCQMLVSHSSLAVTIELRVRPEPD